MKRGPTPAVGFPWLSHRSLAEVDETERLQRLRAADPRAARDIGARLNLLLTRRDAHNPPVDPEAA